MGGHRPTWSDGVGTSSTGPLGRSDAERGVGRAGVLPAPAEVPGEVSGVLGGVLGG